MLKKSCPQRLSIQKWTRLQYVQEVVTHFIYLVTIENGSLLPRHTVLKMVAQNILRTYEVKWVWKKIRFDDSVDVYPIAKS